MRSCSAPRREMRPRRSACCSGAITLLHTGGDTTMRAEIILYDGFDDLDAFAPHEVLRRAAATNADFSVDLVTVDDVESLTSAYGVTLRTPQRLGQPDLLLVPGGGWAARAPRGARAEA